MEQVFSKTEEILAQYPIFEYSHLEPGDLVFSDKVRHICENECENYSRSWACPPAVGSIHDCMERCRKFNKALLFSTLAEVSDCMDFAECLLARRDHEDICRRLSAELREELGETLTLTTGCMICEKCAWPDEPCRNPGERSSSVESHGIVIMQSAANAGLSYDCGGNIVTYFGLILYNSAQG